MYICICVYVYMCICLYLYLSICTPCFILHVTNILFITIISSHNICCKNFEPLGKAGQVITPQIVQLKPDKANMLVFLAENLYLLNCTF